MRRGRPWQAAPAIASRQGGFSRHHCTYRCALRNVRSPLHLATENYRTAVLAALDHGLLIPAEAGALIANEAEVGGPHRDVVEAYQRMLNRLAAATTPERARRVARWSPFDPVALQRRAKRLRREGSG